MHKGKRFAHTFIRIIFGMIILSMILFGCTSKETNLKTVELALMNRIVSAPEGAEVSVAYLNIKTGATILINENERMHAASTMKVPVMIEVFKQAEEGKLSLTDSLIVYNEFKSIVDGSLYSMDIGEDSDSTSYELIGKKSTIGDLNRTMITRSGNLPTNILVDIVGADNIMNTMRSIGAGDVHVLRGVEDMKAYNAGLSNSTTAAGMMKVMEAIATDKVASADANAQMREVLFAQEHRNKIPAKLPSEVRVANKTGWITKISHDAAIVYPPDEEPYILVILTKGIEDNKLAEELMADLSLIIYEAR